MWSWARWWTSRRAAASLGQLVLVHLLDGHHHLALSLDRKVSFTSALTLYDIIYAGMV